MPWCSVLWCSHSEEERRYVPYAFLGQAMCSAPAAACWWPVQRMVCSRESIVFGSCMLASNSHEQKSQMHSRQKLMMPVHGQPAEGSAGRRMVCGGGVRGRIGTPCLSRRSHLIVLHVLEHLDGDHAVEGMRAEPLVFHHICSDYFQIGEALSPSPGLDEMPLCVGI